MMNNNNTGNGEEHFVIRLRGLPWSCSDEEIFNFLGVPVLNGSSGIKRTLTREGRSTGEAYVELHNSDDMNKTLDKDHELMGKRYIEVFSSSFKEMTYIMDQLGRQREDGKTMAGNDTIVRLRGLPYQCTKDEVTQFFSGLEIVANGIVLPLDATGRSTGESYVEFSTSDDATAALGKHKEKIGHRYIEIFKSTRKEMREAFHMDRGNRMRGPGARPGPYDRPRGGARDRMGGFDRRRRPGGYNAGGGYGDYYDDQDEYYEGDGFGGEWGEDEASFGEWGDEYDMRGGYGRRRPGMGDRGRGGFRGGDDYYEDDASAWYQDGYGYQEEIQSDYVVHMRGLPFKAVDDDITNFFSPVVPVRIHREYGDDGRISGEANVEFASYQDAQAAMQKNKDLMQHRYIELFYRGNKNRGGGNQRGGRGSGGRGGMMGSRGRGAGMGGMAGGMMRGRGGSMRGRGGRGGGGFRY